MESWLSIDHTSHVSNDHSDSSTQNLFRCLVWRSVGSVSQSNLEPEKDCERPIFLTTPLGWKDSWFFNDIHLWLFGTEFISHSPRNKFYPAGSPKIPNIHRSSRLIHQNIQIYNLYAAYIIYIIILVSGETRGVSGFDVLPGRGTPSPFERGLSVLVWSDLLHSGSLKTCKLRSP